MKNKSDWAVRAADSIWMGSAVGANWHKRIIAALRRAEKRGYNRRAREARCANHNTVNCIVCFNDVLRQR